ncbi:MAG: hypothetical protein GXY76_09635 [Chloroflexi bacterium]|mgnify:FL=1|nr:hypothetical protein [Chloroflexota bacterium]
MTTRLQTLDEIRAAGLEALARALGPVGMIRFLQQFETGSGDYTQERRAWLGDLTVDEIAERIRHRRAAP